MLQVPTGDPLDIDALLGGVDAPIMFEEPLGGLVDAEMSAEAPITLTGKDLERFKFRLQLSLSTAERNMSKIHDDAEHDRRIYRVLERDQDYPGQPNLTTPISANKADGLLAQVTDAMEQRPIASFVPEGVGKPAEEAAQTAPLCAAYLEREINRGGSRERLMRELQKEAIIVGTGIVKLSMVRHPSGEMFVQTSNIIPLEDFFVDRLRVPNLKHCFSAYRERIPAYQLDEMADANLLDRQALDLLKSTASSMAEPTETEREADFWEQTHAFQEEARVHTVYTCYMRFRPEGASKAELYEAIWAKDHQTLLAVRPNSARDVFDHPAIGLVRIGKQPGHLLGRGIMRRLAPIQRMADNAVNSHLAVNDLAASPPFLYKQHSPFGRLMESKRRILPGMGIPSLSPDRADVQPLDFRNNGLNLQDMSVAQMFADKATFTEEAIGTSSDRKTLGQFRVEVQRGTMRLRLDLGDLAYDMSQLLTMMWAMVVKYKIEPAGIVEVEAGGKFLASRDITSDEIVEVMDRMVMPQFQRGDLSLEELQEFEEEFNARLTNDMVPSARRSDLSIHMTGTKIIADKATELEMLMQLTPLVLQGLDLARKDTNWWYHMHSIIEAMGFKDANKRMPADPGTIAEPEERNQLAAPLAETITRSSNMV